MYEHSGRPLSAILGVLEDNVQSVSDNSEHQSYINDTIEAIDNITLASVRASAREELTFADTVILSILSTILLFGLVVYALSHPLRF